MRVSKAFFSQHGHPLYLQGLETTGISVERIPLISDMDEVLKKIGWRAIAINGFIPPSIFLEFQSLKILAIACDMRKLENLGYTPSPDIVHEAAGHAPIVADPGYRTYLEAYGEVARNAVISKYDLDLYEAIFKLSELKEDPASTPEQIAEAQKNFETVAAQESKPSEVALLTRMAWWTTEYGLIGSVNDPSNPPLIYGAGLLSSVSESFNCLKPEVKKIPFTLQNVIQTSYDITRPQPQLFVAESFDQLIAALDEFANTMAFRKGGLYGLEVAKEAQNTVTVVLDNGVQLSGVVQDIERGNAGEEAGFTLSGAKQISYLDRASVELTTHNIAAKIFVPLFDKAVTGANIDDIQRKIHGTGLHTKSGLRIQGRCKKEVSLGGTTRMLVLEQMKVTDPDGKVIFEEIAKPVPLTLASKVISVFGGAADRAEFMVRNTSQSKKVESHHTNLTPETARLNNYYREVREFREQGQSDLEGLREMHSSLNHYFPKDWLLRLELLELFQVKQPEHITTAHLRAQLHLLASTEPGAHDLIQRGLDLI